MQSAWLILAFIACVGTALLVASVPVLAALDGRDGGGRRVATIDGLRGFLALAVVCHHGAIYQDFLRTGVWAAPPGFAAMLGKAGVSLFFMITGYLFWRRLIARRGRPGWAALFTGRLFRIAPLYGVAAGLAVVTSFAMAPTLNVPWSTLFAQLGRYAAFGLLPVSDVNGVDTSLLLAHVTWTLRYEWLFYFSLPLLAVFARSARTHLAAAASITTVALAMMEAFGTTFAAPPIATFGAGMLAASLQAHGFGGGGYGRPGSVAACLLLGATVFGDPGDVVTTLLLGGAFLLITSGNSLFGLLQTRPAQRLGEISYGLYLLQGLVLGALLLPARALTVASPLSHWAIVILASALLVLAATVAHLVVERRFIRFGQVFVGWARARRPVVLSPDALEPR